MLWKIFKNSQESDALRRMAADALQPKYPIRVRKALQSFHLEEDQQP